MQSCTSCIPQATPAYKAHVVQQITQHNFVTCPETPGPSLNESMHERSLSAHSPKPILFGQTSISWTRTEANALDKYDLSR